MTMAQPQYKPYETLNVDIGVTVLVEPKSVLKLVKCSYIKARKARMLDNPLISNSPAIRYVDMLQRITLYRRSVNLNVVTLEMLFYIYSLYVNGNTAVSIYGIAKVFNKDKNGVSSEMNNVRNKVKVLLERGYLICVGKSVACADLYIPSVRAIDDIENIFAV